LYVASDASGCFKSRSRVARGMCVGSRREHERSPSGRRPRSTPPPPAWACETHAWVGDV
jgi:hypothetical protein